jgi:2-oxoglutarate/2-oxoacid ferredoxin oxidoreductase subunit beta
MTDERRVYDYLRHRKAFPHMWCAGCGIGTVMQATLRAIDALGIAKDDVAMITGIGCTGRMSAYVDFNTMHTTHGRALAFATGLKLARPEMHVIVVMGDGDALAIGGNHFLHAARRNIDITTIVVNNLVYGMTGGQASPATPADMLASTAPYGNIDRPLDVMHLARAAGAAYGGRETVYHAAPLAKMIQQAIGKHGFSVVEAMSYCHTSYGRLNKLGKAVDMMKLLKETSITRRRAESLEPSELEGMIVRGVAFDRDLPEYTDRYQGIIDVAQREAQAEAAHGEAPRAMAAKEGSE